MLNRHIAEADAELEKIVREDEVVRRLCTAPGVGPMTVTTFAASIDDATPSPLLKPSMKGRATAELLGRMFPLAARSHNIKNAIEDDTKGDDRTPLSALLLFFAQEWFDLLPQIVGDMPYCLKSAFASHCFVPSKQNIQVQLRTR